MRVRDKKRARERGREARPGRSPFLCVSRVTLDFDGEGGRGERGEGAGCAAYTKELNLI